METKLKIGIVKAKEIELTFINEYFAKVTGAQFYGSYSIQVVDNLINVFNQHLELVYSDKEIILKPSSKNADIFEIENVEIGINFHWSQKETQRFNGSIKLIIDGDEVQLINIIYVEDYLLSVISSEMNSNSPIEYLKTHAIISRSWVLSRINAKNDRIQNFIENDSKRIKWYGREEHVNFDVCADDHCQRYQGISRIASANVAKAVDETRGIVLMQDGKICDARFSKCCGGVSEDFENVWEDEKIEYLSMVVDSEDKSIDLDLRKEEDAIKWIENKYDSFCNVSDTDLLETVLNNYDQETNDFYRWTVEYSQEEISSLIKERSGIDLGNIISLNPIKRGRSGRIYELEIVGSKRSFIFGKELEIRKVLSESHLYSSAFFTEYKDIIDDLPHKFIIHGAGWGHGVGLCQIGAANMVEKSYNHEEILSHYFKGSTLKSIY
ncbi:SpoIID/LytB domain-containing protein [Marinilabiliaceae bacterium JC040]|nr:SpoIID/LytB domain-containing protein [Marinilabiliaceae bacterium JC040]